MPAVIVLMIWGETLSVGLSDKPEIQGVLFSRPWVRALLPRLNRSHLGGDVSCFNSRSTVVVFVS